MIPISPQTNQSAENNSSNIDMLITDMTALTINTTNPNNNNTIDSNKSVTLHDAVKRGDIEQVNSLIEKRVFSDIENTHKTSALKIALDMKNSVIANLLLKKGYRVHTPDCRDVSLDVIEAASILVNYGLKKSLGPLLIKTGNQRLLAKEQQIHKLYDGVSNKLALKTNLLENQFLTSQQEKYSCDQAKILQKQRCLLRELTILSRSNYRKVISLPALLCDRVEQLSQENSDYVISSSPHQASFCIEGGVPGHSVVYEMKRIDDDFFFIIHNRGRGLHDPLHGFFSISINDLLYQKTSVSIKVSKEHFTEEFFDLLLTSKIKKNCTMDSVYEIIREYLLQKVAGGITGEIVLTPLEKKTKKLYILLIRYQSQLTFIILNQCQSLKGPALKKACSEAVNILSELIFIVKTTKFDAELEIADDWDKLKNSVEALKEYLDPSCGFPLDVLLHGFSHITLEKLLSFRNLLISKDMNFTQEQLKTKESHVRNKIKSLQSEIYKASKELMISNVFQSTQKYGTCQFSAMTGPEKSMNVKNCTIRLKSFIVDKMINIIEQDVSIASPIHPDVKKELLALGKIRQANLHDKLKNLN